LPPPATLTSVDIAGDASRALALPDAQIDGLVAAKISSSVGYLTFSKPVVVRSILARWRAPPASGPPAVVGGRLGLQTAWTTHLDPARLRRAQGWIDIGGNPFRPVDELVFLATSGLEVGAVEVAAHEGDEERTVLLLTPVADTGAGDTTDPENGVDRRPDLR